MLLTVRSECWTPRCSQLGIECTREACNKQMVSGLNYGREHTTECSYDQRSQQHRDRLSAPFLQDRIFPKAFFFLPDLKLVHSSEKTNIESPGFTLQSLCLSLCWGWGGVIDCWGFSRTYYWFSSKLWSLDWKKWIHSISLYKYVPRERTPDRHCPQRPYSVPDTHWVCRICWANTRVVTRLMLKLQ